MNRIYTYRVEGLTSAKHRRLEALFAHLTWLYNQGVEHMRTQYAESGKTPTRYDLYKWLTSKRSEDTRTSQWHIRCQRSVLARVRRGYDKFFRDKKGKPRFKSFDRGVRSFETDVAKPRQRSSGSHYVHIKGIGRLSFIDTRGAMEHDVKLVRIVRNALRYEIQLVCEVNEELKVVDNRSVLGIDLGVKAPITLSNGMQYAPISVDETKRKRMQRKVSRAKRGSNGRKKAKALLAKESHRLAVKRRNAIHRMTTDVVRNRSANLVIEDLKVQNMTRKGGSRKRGLNRAMREQSLGIIATQLVYKAASAGGECVKVAPHNTTQMCSHCHSLPRESIGLSVRIYVCEHCGYVEDRDVNAARNVRRKGLASFSRVGLSPAGQAKAVKPVRLDTRSRASNMVMAQNRSTANLNVALTTSP